MYKHIKIRNNTRILIQNCQDSKNPFDKLGKGFKYRLKSDEYEFININNLTIDYSYDKKNEIDQVFDEMKEKIFYVGFSVVDGDQLTFFTVKKSESCTFYNNVLGYIIAPKETTKEFINNLLEEHSCFMSEEVYKYSIETVEICECCKTELKNTEMFCSGVYFGTDFEENGLINHLKEKLELNEDELKLIKKEIYG